MNMPTIEGLLDDVRSNDPTKQVNALIELIKLHADSAVLEFVPLLASDDSDVREEAARALGFMGSAEREKVGPALLKAINDPDELVRSEIVEALGLLAYQPAIASLQSLLHNDPSWIVRASAAEALGNFEDQTLLPDLEQALSDEEAPVAAYAASSIGLIAQPDYLPTLETFIARETVPTVKKNLIEASYRLGGKDSLQQLLDLLQMANEDSAPGILNSIEALTQQKPPTSLRKDAPRLREALDDLAQRLPFWKAHVEEILEQLTKLEQAA